MQFHEGFGPSIQRNNLHCGTFPSSICHFLNISYKRRSFHWLEHHVCLFHTVPRAAGGSENPGVPSSNVVGIICPPGSWDKVNWSVKILGYHGIPSGWRTSQPRTFQPQAPTPDLSTPTHPLPPHPLQHQSSPTDAALAMLTGFWNNMAVNIRQGRPFRILTVLFKSFNLAC